METRARFDTELRGMGSARCKSGLSSVPCTPPTSTLSSGASMDLRHEERAQDYPSETRVLSHSRRDSTTGRVGVGTGWTSRRRSRRLAPLKEPVHPGPRRARQSRRALRRRCVAENAAAT